MSGPTITVRVAANSMEIEQCTEQCVAVNGYLCNQGLAATGTEGNDEHTLNMFIIDEGYYHFLLLLLDGNQSTTFITRT